jgi:hypothetical protein
MPDDDNNISPDVSIRIPLKKLIDMKFPDKPYLDRLGQRDVTRQNHEQQWPITARQGDKTK